jgi:hypothetical protein
MWYQPIEEDIYFIMRLSRREEDFLHFLDLPSSVVGESHLAYV